MSVRHPHISGRLPAAHSPSGAGQQASRGVRAVDMAIARRKLWGFSPGSEAGFSPGFNPPFGGCMLNSLLSRAIISTWSINETNIAST